MAKGTCGLSVEMAEDNVINALYSAGAAYISNYTITMSSVAQPSAGTNPPPTAMPQAPDVSSQTPQISFSLAPAIIQALKELTVHGLPDQGNLRLLMHKYRVVASKKLEEEHVSKQCSF